MYSLPRSSQIVQPSPRVMIGTLWPSRRSCSSKIECRVKCIHRWSRAASEYSAPVAVCRSELGSQMSDGSVLIGYPSCSAAC